MDLRLSWLYWPLIQIILFYLKTLNNYSIKNYNIGGLKMKKLARKKGLHVQAEHLLSQCFSTVKNCFMEWELTQFKP